MLSVVSLLLQVAIGILLSSVDEVGPLGVGFVGTVVVVVDVAVCVGAAVDVVAVGIVVDGGAVVGVVVVVAGAVECETEVWM